MYYEEKVINGVLCYRDSHDGEWTPFTIEALTTALITMKRKAEDLQTENDELEDRVFRVKRELLRNPDYSAN